MKRIINRAINPIKFFIGDSRSTGVLLIFCTIVSLIITNGNLGEGYRALWNSEIHYGSHIKLPHSALAWINDFLMAIFFLFAGMEIKRELIEGELSSFKKAILPLGAALGGMIVPALFYIAFNLKSGYAHGWGIPTATDIAFSLGIASLFGKRVPVALTIFLMALAIIDDLGAIVVITLFYGGNINWLVLGGAGLVYGLLWLCNYRNIKPGAIHVILSIALWYLMFNSGIEASISGVLIAFAMPVNALPKLEKAIHGVVNFLILPLFALANTAIVIPPDVFGALQNSIGLGVMSGLVLGKPIGIFLFSALMVWFKFAKLPSNTSLKQLFGVGSLAGIGFTMSIFTTTLAFSTELNRDISKISILVSLVFSVVLSGVYFAVISRKPVTKASEVKSLTPEVSMS